MKSKREFSKRKLLAGVGLALFLAAPATAWAQSTGECLRVEVPAPIVLPDGSTRAAGMLRICATRRFSPVSSLHETSVDGIKVGLLQSRRGTSEGPIGDVPFVLFESQDGDMRLIGCAWPTGDARMATYRFAEPTRPGRVARSLKNGEPALPVKGNSIVLLIARVE